jgi:hypothetical protein
MKSKRNVTECRDCKKYQNHDCIENRIRQHRKVGREIAKNPHKISGECEGFAGSDDQTEAIPAPEKALEPDTNPKSEKTSKPKSFDRFLNWDKPPFNTKEQDNE